MDHPVVTFVWKENPPLPSWLWTNCETGATSVTYTGCKGLEQPGLFPGIIFG